MSISCASAPITGCLAGTLAQVRACLASGQNAILTNDIVVSGADCDGPGVLDVSQVQGNGIHGNGHKILRTSGQELCSLVHGTGSKGFFSDSVVWEETPGPEVPVVDAAPDMFRFNEGCDICFLNSEIAHSWDYAVYLNGVDGFKFKSSVLRDSGVLGLYVGHSSNPTQDYEICGNQFLCNTTNALALLGALNGVVEDNLFDDNHKLGVFPVAPQFGTGYTGGGQVYVAEANGLAFRNNTIQNGSCSNCVTAGIFANPVTGLELGIPNQGTTVFNAEFDGNTITNNTAWGAHLNSNSTLDSTTQFCGNTITGNGTDIGIPLANYKP